MNPVTTQIQTKTFVAIIFLTVLGLFMILIPMLAPHTAHHYPLGMLGLKITGWFFFVVGILSILMLKKVIIHQQGIRVEYYIGKKVDYKFEEIVDVSAEINAGGASIGGRMSHDGKHRITLIPMAGKLKIMLSSASYTNFELFFNALYQVYGTRMRVIDKGVRVG